jgi:hypothetical protein
LIRIRKEINEKKINKVEKNKVKTTKMCSPVTKKQPQSNMDKVRKVEKMALKIRVASFKLE